MRLKAKVRSGSHSLNGVYAELPFDISFDYYPPEPAVMYPNDDAYPGSDEELTITEVKFLGVDLANLLTEPQLRQFEEEASAYMQAMYEQCEEAG